MLGKRSSPEKTKDKENQSDDHIQNKAASQEIQSDGPGIISPLKKQRPDDHEILPQENIGAPLLRTPGKKNTTVTDDQVERKDLGSSSWSSLPESYCLSKTLTSSDLTPEITKLHLDVSEARTLAEDPDITYHPPYRYQKNLMIVDAENRRYDMQISNYIGDGSVKYWVGGDWEQFVTTHNLKAGDEVTFHKSETGGLVLKVGRYVAVVKRDICKSKYEKEAKTKSC